MKTIHVTQDDIQAGISNSGDLCPIALALKRVFPGKYVEVGNVTAAIENIPDMNEYGDFVDKEPELDRHVYNLPWSAIEFIERFDRGDFSLPPVSPFELVS